LNRFLVSGNREKIH